MNGFEQRRKKKMEDILHTAFKLFTERGFKTVSIAEIAEKAKVSQVSIYNFFGSKENLAKDAFFTFMNEKMSEIEALLDNPIPFREKIEKMLFDGLGANLDQEFIQSALLTDPLVQDFLQEYYQTRTIPFLLNLIEQGRKEGCFDSTLSNEAILLYIGMFKNTLTQSDLSPKTRSDLGVLFFNGLFGA